MVQFTNEEIKLSIPTEKLPESWKVQWRYWLDGLDADRITTADIRRAFFQIKENE